MHNLLFKHIANTYTLKIHAIFQWNFQSHTEFISIVDTKRTWNYELYPNFIVFNVLWLFNTNGYNKERVRIKYFFVLLHYLNSESLNVFCYKVVDIIWDGKISVKFQSLWNEFNQSNQCVCIPLYSLTYLFLLIRNSDSVSNSIDITRLVWFKQVTKYKNLQTRRVCN